MANPGSYYLIHLEPAPRRLRILLNREDGYSWKYFGNNPTMCEISFLQEGEMRETLEKGERIYPQGSVFCLVDDHPCLRYSNSPALQEFFFNFYTVIPPIPISEDRVADWFSTRNEAILPDIVTDPAVCQQIGDLLKPAVALFRQDDVVRGLKLRACMYECLSLLTRYSVERARSSLTRTEQKRNSVYTDRACAYMDGHIRERIRMADVAAYAGISYSHLKTLFLRDTGMTMTDYISRGKIRLVQHHITVDGMTLHQAGLAVALPEPKYLSRLFRRCTGVTVQDYRRIFAENPGHAPDLWE